MGLKQLVEEYENNRKLREHAQTECDRLKAEIGEMCGGVIYGVVADMNVVALTEPPPDTEARHVADTFDMYEKEIDGVRVVCFKDKEGVADA